MTDWYIQQSDEGAEIGPLRPAELLEMVREGRVTKETLIRKDDSAWFAADNVGGLFEAARRPTIEYFCPQCDTRVTEPPVTCPSCGRSLLRARTTIIEHTIADPTSGTKSSRSVQDWLKKKRLKNKQDDAKG